MRRRGREHRLEPAARPQPRRGPLLAAIPALVLGLLLAAAGPAAQSAEAGCAPKPGAPDQGALHQYCPKKAKGDPARGGPDTTRGGGVGGGTDASGDGGPRGDRAGGSSGAGVEVPLTDYPSTGGVNALLAILLGTAALAGGYEFSRRWRARREAP